MSLQILPGVGPKTAKRLAMFLLGENKDGAKNLSISITTAIDSVRQCEICGVLNDLEVCSICSDSSRDNESLCIVESTSDLFAIEETNEFKGKYFVLLGRLSPIDNIGPEDLGIDDLLRIISTDEIKEVILATSSTVEGDATAIFIKDHVNNAKVSRISYGIPIGGELEYVDGTTIARAIEGRVEINVD